MLQLLESRTVSCKHKNDRMDVRVFYRQCWSKLVVGRGRTELTFSGECHFRKSYHNMAVFVSRSLCGVIQ